jgi:hypothetical protein
MVRSADAVYLLSEWAGISNAKAVGVSKLNLEGRPIWTKELPETSRLITSGVGKARTCPIVFGVLRDGDLMIGCTAGEKIQFIRLKSQTGTSEARTVAKPYCRNGGSTSVLLLAPKDDRTLWVFGSKPRDLQERGCTWLAEIPIGRD